MIQPRVVVFEDDEASRTLLVTILEQKGYEVISASEPTACPIYAKLEGTCPHEFACGDFLLTDNRMPRMSGLEFIALQQTRCCKGVMQNKAVISCSWEASELERASELGCRVFSKPYRFEEILAWFEERAGKIPSDRMLDDLTGFSKI
jgi:CheY-like chemotaxis protein